MKKSRQQKILLAAGVFYPDVGGPAIHVRKMAERLLKEGFELLVIAYGDDPHNTNLGFPVLRISRKQPKIFQWLKYFLAVFRHSFGAKVLYGFDTTAAGIPPAIMALLLHKPYVLRIGGDPIWERQAELSKRLMPLEKYYELGLYRKDSPFLYFIIKTILKIPRAIVVYNQNWKDFYTKYFSVLPNKISIIKNPVFRRETGLPTLSGEPIILFAGRFVAYKNLELVIKAFSKIGKGKLILIGSGPEKNNLQLTTNNLQLESKIVFINPLPQEKLFEYIRNSAICIGPALSEFNPNFILEALSFGKPVLISRGHGLSVELSEMFIFDPMNQRELEEKITWLFNPANYQKAVEMVSKLPLNQSWEDVTNAHLAIIKQCIQAD